ncbi:hypothetical protein F5877DRAFT_63599 [Lentinula edodes]|nr:hypothetical protein F5877DRAFT_63599 [Lentinula edodes]
MTTPTQITEMWNSLSSLNEPFSPDNITFLRQCMHDLNLNISGIPMKFRRLIERRRQCEAILRGIGFRKLPPELMSEIFLCVTRPVLELNGNYALFPHFLKVPFILSRVCRRWRTVALSTPALWTRFMVMLHGTSQAELVECILERSRLLPLHVVVSSRDNGKRADMDNFLRAMNTLISNISRLEKLALFILNGADGLPPTLPLVPPAGAPNMRVIQFHNLNSPEPSKTIAWLSELLHGSPNLQSLYLRSAEKIQLESAAWVHLQHFKASYGIRLQDLFALFVYCAELRTCEVQLHAPIQLDIAPTTEIALQHLDTLTLTNARGDDLKAVFRWLTFPSLKKLTLSGFRGAEWPDELFLNFLSRSRFSLKSLSLATLLFTEANLVSYLHHPSIHDSLEELIICQWGEKINASFLDYLTFKLPSSSDAMHNPPPFLPKLFSISLTVNAIDHAVALRRFVASRWYDIAAYEVPLPVANLKYIHVRFIVPYAPNVNVSIDEIKHVFSRIARSRGTGLRFETIAVLSDQYNGIERLTSQSVI